MYIPKAFLEDDQERLLAFIERFPLATLATANGSDVTISHIPMLSRKTSEGLFLTGHMAKANPHLSVFEGRPTTAVFHGPQGYISPTWYATSPAVPTWNYSVVHATGMVFIRADEALSAQIVRELTERHEREEGRGWNPELLPPDLRRDLQDGIVAFELRVDRLVGNFKLSQNRAEADRLGAASGLEATGSPLAQELASMMRGALR